MKIRLTLLTLALALAGCATHGYAPRVQQRYAVNDYLARTTRYAVAPAPSYGYGYGYGYAAPAATYAAPVATGAYSTANPCAPCAPQSRTIYYDAGTATVDHVHRYREIHRHRIEVTAEDIGCVDCP